MAWGGRLGASCLLPAGGLAVELRPERRHLAAQVVLLRCQLLALLPVGLIRLLQHRLVALDAVLERQELVPHVFEVQLRRGELRGHEGGRQG